MSVWTKKLPVDFVIGLDPGYATQGIAAYDCRGKSPLPILCRSTCTDSGQDLHSRIDWQFRRIEEALSQLGLHGMRSNALLVLEEFHNTGHTSSATAVYCRGVYDGLFRHRIAPRFQYAITLHPMLVRFFSSPYGNKKKDKDKLRDKVYDGSPQGVLYYIKALWPELLPKDREHASLPFYQMEHLGKKPSGKSVHGPSAKGHWVGHSIDALLMATVGLLAFVYPDVTGSLDGQQKEKLKALTEIYDFRTEASRDYR